MRDDHCKADIRHVVAKLKREALQQQRVCGDCKESSIINADATSKMKGLKLSAPRSDFCEIGIRNGATHGQIQEEKLSAASYRTECQ